MIRFVATSRCQRSATILAPPRLVLRKRSMQPIPKHQQLRSITTTLGGAVLETVSWAAILAPLVLIMRSLRRKHINKQLQNTLDQASQLQDQQRRRQVFFDIASRYARNNGCRVGLDGTLDYEINIDALFGNLGANVSACDIKRLGPHNLRFSIQKSKLRKWKVWVAVDADFHVHSDDEASSPSHGPIGTDSASDNREATLSNQAVLDPFIAIVLILMKQRLASAGNAMSEQAEGSSHFEVPEEVSVELLFRNTVISLEVITRDMSACTYWIGKMGERRPSGFEWIIIPIPSLFDI